METHPLYIGGQTVTEGAVRTIPLPYDGSPVAQVLDAPAAVIDRAVEAAQQGQKAMAAMTNAERSDLLFRLHGILSSEVATLGTLIAQETGKPLREARVEADRGMQTLLNAAIEARQLHGEVIPIDGAPVGASRMAMTVREPVGVIAAITPFNVPFNLALHKIGPALAAGNAVIHKPAEQTPLSAFRIAEGLRAAGAPAGAYNLITGEGKPLGEAIVAHPGIRMITFTGSVAVGKWLRANCGLKKITLELGNNSGVIIEPDADLDLAVARTVAGGFANSGQVCISIQRIYVHESIASKFTEALKAAVEKLRIGHPLEEATEHSSLISEDAAKRVESWIQDSVSKGARLVTGGTREFATIPPTVLEHVPDRAKTMSNEIFGPVVNVNTYKDTEEAIAKVNDTPYGLQAAVFTKDFEKAFRMARKLQVGGVILNDTPSFRADLMPYGGIKESGLGREGPRYAIEEMTDTKVIVWKV
ncbi:MAG: aldehyde dehydrogenase family protein [Acidobacteria bacterium]|nr:aldehyde dehydrogenase family protein [Acidobacteriota bacterium]